MKNILATDEHGYTRMNTEHDGEVIRVLSVLIRGSILFEVMR